MSQVDLFLFDVAGLTWGADAAQVLRVDREREGSVGAPLGAPLEGRRALVFHDREGAQRRLAIDLARGVQQVPVAALRRLPSLAHGARAVGAWLDGERTVLLVDLVQLCPNVT
jgi:hypothetical protein